MVRKGHKRKNNHVVIVTSDATDGKVRQFRVRPWVLQIVILIQCVIIGALIGFFLYERDVWAGEFQQTKEESEGESERVAQLEQEKAQLESQVAGLSGEIEDLNETIGILSETVKQKTQSESELSEQLLKQTMPTEFPLTGKTSMEETAEGNGNPICIFTASKGSMVVAAAGGSVTVVSEDPEYGNNVWVDHGNGYATIYRCPGEVKVRQGETVTQGATLFVVTGDDSRLGYQMTRDGVYISPMEVLEISG